MQDAHLDRTVIEIGEITADGAGERIRAANQVLGGRENGITGHGHVSDDGADARQGLTHFGGDLCRLGTDTIELQYLLLDDDVDVLVDAAHVGDAAVDRKDCLGGVVHRLLDTVDLRADVFGGFRGTA